MSEVFKSWQQGGLRAIAKTGSLDYDAGDSEWQECGADGFWIKPLLEDESAGLRTWLMKVDPGAYSPAHAHDDIEQVYILEGSFYDQDKTYGPGQYIVRDAGAMHSGGSENGALMLLFYSPAG